MSTILKKLFDKEAIKKRTADCHKNYFIEKIRPVETPLTKKIVKRLKEKGCYGDKDVIDGVNIALEILKKPDRVISPRRQIGQVEEGICITITKEHEENDVDYDIGEVIFIVKTDSNGDHYPINKDGELLGYIDSENYVDPEGWFRFSTDQEIDEFFK